MQEVYQIIKRFFDNINYLLSFSLIEFYHIISFLSIFYVAHTLLIVAHLSQNNIFNLDEVKF